MWPGHMGTVNCCVAPRAGRPTRKLRAWSHKHELQAFCDVCSVHGESAKEGSGAVQAKIMLLQVLL